MPLRDPVGKPSIIGLGPPVLEALLRDRAPSGTAAPGTYCFASRKGCGGALHASIVATRCNILGQFGGRRVFVAHCSMGKVTFGACVLCRDCLGVDRR